MLEERLLSFALSGAEWVLYLLVALSVACAAVTLERLIFIFINRTPKNKLRSVLSQFSIDSNVENLRKELKGLRGAQARVLLAGSNLWEKGVPSVEEALLSATAKEKSRMEKFLMVLGTTGSNAPFIGLFGTVLGIIKAFADLANNQAEAASAVMAGISEALVATATGLLVAIPAVVIYNLFQRYNKTVISELDSLAHFLLAYMKGSKEN